VKSRCGIVLLLVALAALLIAAIPAVSLASTELTTYEQQIVKYVNQERAKAGLGKLKVSAKLVQSARAHSTDMGENKYFEHDSLDGTAWGERIVDHGYKRDGYRVWKAGENIAWGAGLYSAPVLIVDDWMASATHRAVILSKDFKEIGVGAVSTQGYGSIDGEVWFFTMDAGLRAK
jgi:uncharacterized protein YkwD